MESKARCSTISERDGHFLRPSNGEIHYIWWYMQGSIMNPEVRGSLRRAWGFCERHAWLALSIEASLRHSFLMGPAIVYEELMGRANQIMKKRGPWGGFRRLTALRAHGRCLMCEMGLGPHSRGFPSPEVVVKAQDTRELMNFAEITKPFWEMTVCGVCAGSESKVLCRSHLIEGLVKGHKVNLQEQRELVKSIANRLHIYSRAFVWEHRGTDTMADRAALISAVGWTSGWGPLIRLVYDRKGKRS
ncbi:MAG: hypothetical protein N2572_08545 [Syntrophales bacterium]|nr:hypothetical protein [Syntrophales bacterium]